MHALLALAPGPERRQALGQRCSIGHSIADREPVAVRGPGPERRAAKVQLDPELVLLSKQDELRIELWLSGRTARENELSLESLLVEVISIMLITSINKLAFLWPHCQSGRTLRAIDVPSGGASMAWSVFPHKPRSQSQG